MIGPAMIEIFLLRKYGPRAIRNIMRGVSRILSKISIMAKKIKGILES